MRFTVPRTSLKLAILTVSQLDKEDSLVSRTLPCLLALSALWLLAPLGAQESSVWRDPSPHQVRFVKADDNVRLEVLDWGGSGRPVVLLAGLANTAHVFR